MVAGQPPFLIGWILTTQSTSMMRCHILVLLAVHSGQFYSKFHSFVGEDLEFGWWSQSCVASNPTLPSKKKETRGSHLFSWEKTT